MMNRQEDRRRIYLIQIMIVRPIIEQDEEDQVSNFEYIQLE